MSKECTPTANGGPAEKSSRWTDSEKIALLVSISKSKGDKIVWSNVEVPAGRTTGTCMKQYENIIKQAAGVTMTGGNNITPASKKRKAANSDDANGNATTTKAKKPRAPRKKAEPKAPKSSKVSPAKSTATATASDDDEEIKDEEGLAVKEEEDCDGLVGDDVAEVKEEEKEEFAA